MILSHTEQEKIKPLNLLDPKLSIVLDSDCCIELTRSYVGLLKYCVCNILNALQFKTSSYKIQCILTCNICRMWPNKMNYCTKSSVVPDILSFSRE